MSGSIRLSGSQRQSSIWTFARRIWTSRTSKDLQRAISTSYPLPLLPVRIRPAFVVLCALSLLILSLLGFHPTLARRIQPPIPLSDKLLHFVCFACATSLFYAVWLVNPDARVSQPWMYLPEYLSVAVCLVAGGIGSEFVQALLPYKEFQWLDVVANLLGGTVGIYAARKLTIRHRKQKELRRMYDPVDEELGFLSSDEDDLDERDDRRQASSAARNGSGTKGEDRRRMDVWNASDADHDSLFEVGDLEDDIEQTRTRTRSRSVLSQS